MIGLLHGYLLEGSGSNLWTRSVVRALCAMGETVHLFCQEPYPDAYDFVAQAFLWDGGRAERLFDREVPYPGRCVLHKPIIGEVLPVFVRDQYEEFDEEDVVPMIELPDEEIEAYVRRNTAVVRSAVRAHGITVLHANHAVLMPVVAQRVRAEEGVPYAVMPHGSAIEYAVKRDARFLDYAAAAFRAAGAVFVIGEEMRRRVERVFGSRVPEVLERLHELNLGVDTSEFGLVPRPERGRSVERLIERLRELPRGRTPGQTAELHARLHRGIELPALARALDASRAYTAKTPDADLEDRLHRVPWSETPLLLFVGRLIAAKGAHAIVAALPLILERVPEARLILVGHGPLREVLEALVWALRRDERELVWLLGRAGGALESDAAPGEPSPLPELLGLLRSLEREDRLDAYFRAAARRIGPDTVLFTGYLTHDELRHLYPCCDVAVFPSIVPEAGPLVFLEALASGCFPLGTYFAGMAASIDAATRALPPEVSEWMKLTPEPDRVAADVARKVPEAIGRAEVWRESLRRVAVERYDWSRVAERLRTVLESLAARPAGGRAG